MTTKYVRILALAGIPLAAQSWEGGVFLGQQTYGTDSFGRYTSEVKSRTIGSLRLGYKLFDFESGFLQTTISYQPKTAADVSISSGIKQTFEYSHDGIGVIFNFKYAINLGIGIDYRLESLKFGNNPKKEYNRPWFRTNAIYNFQKTGMIPFLGFEIATPMVRTHQANPENMAPKLQVGIYGGIRF